MTGLGRIAPVAVPIRLRDLLSVRDHVRRGDCELRFAAALAGVTGAREVRLFSSGRAALAAGLQQLAGASRRREVVVPAYTCYTVPASVVRAGLLVRLCDVAPDTLDYDPEALERAVTEHTLAVLAVHPLGLPCEIGAIVRLAHQRGAMVVEDCAQLLGVTVGGRPVGATGDLAILSFGRGKPITCLGGGALLTSLPDLTGHVQAAAKDLPIRRALPGRLLATAAAYGLLTRPAGFRFAELLPGLGIGVTRFDPRFPIASMEYEAAALGLVLLERLPKLNRARQMNAAALYDLFASASAFVPLRGSASDATGAPLRFPLRVPAGLRADVQHLLRAAGIGASAMYPAPLGRVGALTPYLAGAGDGYPGATEAARQLLTLPCHPSLGRNGLARVMHAVRRTFAQFDREPAGGSLSA
jgi:dTDP-4-amino-4,6-dideoxygalactose transaminase